MGHKYSSRKMLSIDDLVSAFCFEINGEYDSDDDQDNYYSDHVDHNINYGSVAS